jgi:hypothetical protein
MWIDHELECGCKIRTSQITETSQMVEVEYCSLHGAAEDMLEMLKSVRKWFVKGTDEMADKLDAMIARASA